MNPNDIIDTAKKISDIAPQAYSDMLHPAAQNTGQALETVTGILNTLLTPIEILNKTIAAKKENFLDEYNQNLNNIPKNKTCPINFAAVGPMLEHLKYKITEDELRQRYAKLISEASNIDSSTKPLLSFDNVLDQLTPYEIELLSSLFSALPDQNYALASIKKTSNLGYSFPYKNISGINFKGLPFQTISIMLSNFERLGLIQIDYMQYVEPASKYDYITYSPLFNKLKKECEESREKTGFHYPECSIEKHSFNLTAFGKSFVTTVIA